MSARWWMAIAAVAGLAVVQVAAKPSWSSQRSGVKARLRGVSAVSDTIVWASGANGTVLRTEDGGRRWVKLAVPGAEALDFRDIDAVDERAAFVLSIGPGDASRIYRTTDAGATWTLQFTNEVRSAFFDAMAFWDGDHGVAVSDSVEGEFFILMTGDGGRTWTRVPPDRLPAAQDSEGFFAASGTNVATDAGATWSHMGLRETGRIGKIIVHPTNPDIVFACALGRATGPQEERGVFRTTDGGHTWQRTLFVDRNTGSGVRTMRATRGGW